MSPAPIGASELVLSPRGTVYHLDLHPDQLANTVITVGDPARVGEVSKHFDTIEHRASHREFVTHTGRVGSRRLSVVSTGIGPDNADIVMNELDALANIDFATRIVRPECRRLSVIRIGTAGSVRPEIAVDSFVATSFGIGLDNLMHYYQYTSNPDETFILNDFKSHTGLKSGPVMPYAAEGAIRLRTRFVEGFHTGITVTCAGFYGPQGRALRGALAYPALTSALSTFESRGERLCNLEMETAAIYGLGKILGHHCVSLSVIVNNRLHKTVTGNSAAAVEKLILKALPVVAAL